MVGERVQGFSRRSNQPRFSAGGSCWGSSQTTWVRWPLSQRRPGQACNHNRVPEERPMPVKTYKGNIRFNFVRGKTLATTIALTAKEQSAFETFVTGGLDRLYKCTTGRRLI